MKNDLHVRYEKVPNATYSPGVANFEDLVYIRYDSKCDDIPNGQEWADWKYKHKVHIHFRD
jgi:hypothetical protein